MVRTEISLFVKNAPGELGKLSSLFADAGININYVYGSVAPSGGKCLFVICPEDVEQASKIFKPTS